MADVISNLAAAEEQACASEPIHVPGGIQPHGVLLSIDSRGIVIQASDNVEKCSGLALSDVLGQPLERSIGTAAAALALNQINARVSEATPLYAGSIDGIEGAEMSGPFAVIVHRHAGSTIVELEPARGTTDVFASMYPLVRAFVNDLQQHQTVEGLAQLAANEVKRITGFGRTLVYRFDEQGHGHVLAEAIDEGYASYLGQRFPASDIPSQARELYRVNRIRLIADANYRPARLVPAMHPETGKLTDLTYASLRSVSPVHTQYMKNMGTLSSMSMSIIVDGQLWGLISCHHAQPRLPHFEVRTACEHIAQILSLQVEAKETQAGAAYSLSLRATLARLLASMADRESFIDALADDAADLLKITASAGAAVVFEGQSRLIGTTPDKEQIDRLVQWLDTRMTDIFATDNISRECDAVNASENYAGFLAVSISRVFRNYVIWFRPEVVRTIDWAGDPRGKLASLPGSLSPRESFETWTEIVRDRALPWQRAEVEIALEFRTALLGIVLRRAEELAQLAMELGRANRELENFSYSVSHDLRAPLRHISAFADLIVEMDGQHLPERVKKYMERIRTSAKYGGQLVDELLGLAQMGRAALKPQTIDMRQMVTNIVREMQVGTGRIIEWNIHDLLPVEADPVFMQAAMRNLIENAVKFTSKLNGDATPWIEVGSTHGTDELSGEQVYFVRDNGVGFDMRYVDKLFGVFQRLHDNEEFGGTGIGLATVRRIVERHSGSVWAQGVVGKGATFFFALPATFRPESGARTETPASALARLAATSDGAIIHAVRKDRKER